MSSQEDNPGVDSFRDTCKANRHLVEYLKGAILYSDGGTCLPRFVDGFDGMIHKRCFEHLIK